MRRGVRVLSKRKFQLAIGRSNAVLKDSLVYIDMEQKGNDKDTQLIEIPWRPRAGGSCDQE